VERGITPSPEKLEADITAEHGNTALSDEFSSDGVLFYGDIVEFMPSTVSETTIEDVYHRFNTAQRETDSEEYRKLIFDEIKHDDYDIGETFTVSEESMIDEDEHANLVPEGYYYKPHYRVLIREFENEVNQGNHILVNFSEITKLGNRKWKLKTAKNYYFEPDRFIGEEQVGYASVVHARKFEKGVFYEVNGKCTDVGGPGFTEVTIEMDDDTDIKRGGYKIYRENTEMPEGAYELKDGSGRYLWRNVLSYADMTTEDALYDDVFTNGAHYFHSNIMFYLKRQDPDGTYGIGNEPYDMASFVSVIGKEKDVEYAEYVEEGKISTC
jgi:hypothetical protein